MILLTPRDHTVTFKGIPNLSGRVPSGLTFNLTHKLVELLLPVWVGEDNRKLSVDIRPVAVYAVGVCGGVCGGVCSGVWQKYQVGGKMFTLIKRDKIEM